MKILPRIYDPWIGTAFQKGSGLLVLSESAYTWPGGGPKRDHPTVNTVQTWSICEDKWNHPGRGNGVYARVLTRTLCQKSWPSQAERTAAWNDIAYSIYVQRVLDGPKDRPKSEDISGSEQAFLELLELVQPSRVVVTGKTVWDLMPFFDANGAGENGAYKLTSGQLAWAIGVPHPQSRNPRYRWEEVGARLHDFLEQNFRLAELAL